MSSLTTNSSLEEVTDTNSSSCPKTGQVSESDEVCPECNGLLIFDTSRGEMTCGNCGLVCVSGLIDPGADWRAYNTQEINDRAHTGSPMNPLIEDFGLRTAIGSLSRDGQGNKIPAARRFDLARLSRLDNRSRNGEIRNLRVALRELHRIRSHLELSEGVAKAASLIYRKTLREDLVRGRSIDSMIAASTYLAIRETGMPLTLKDILVATPNLSSKELGRCVRVIIRGLDLKTKSSDFIKLIHRLGESLKMSMESRAIAVDIVEQARTQGITVGKNPMSIAAASLYIAGLQLGERRTQLDVAKIAQTTPVTIRNRFKELTALLNLEEIQIKRGPASPDSNIRAEA